ncbi:MAG: hypothetical protein LBB91_04305, partial [Clostridiales bacterium]|nr:hypothetical protein [Clostridiales bacterium]
MFMDSIRRGRKKYRVVLIIVVVLLVFSLVGAYAFMGGNRGNVMGGGEENTIAQALQYARGMQSAVDNAKAKADEEPDYTTCSQAADTYYQQASYYAQAENPEMAKVLYDWAGYYYGKTMENAPEGLNDLGQDQIIQKQADAYTKAEKNDMVNKVYRDFARSIQPASNSAAAKADAEPDHDNCLQAGDTLYRQAAYYAQGGETGTAAPIYIRAGDYYGKALDYPPEDMDDLRHAQILTTQANAYSMAEENDKAKSAYQQAVALVPTDYSINEAYAYFLWGAEGMDAMEGHFKDFREKLPEGEDRDKVDQWLE